MNSSENTSATNSRGKRRIGFASLAFLGLLFVVGIWEEDTAGEYAKFLTPFVFTFTGAMYGTDAYFANKRKES